MKIASIVGARPEFVQAAIVSEAFRRNNTELLIHTGQHYDDLMSDVFFRELRLPEPDVNLSVGSGAPSAQLAQLIDGISRVLRDEKPDIVIVRGDTNSTLAGAIAARQNGFPLAHIEAGMRSFDARMPEETNRRVSDHLSDWLFVTGDDAAANLAREGITKNVHVVGDVMFDTYLRVTRQVLPAHGVSFDLPSRFDLLTIHRQDNTENADKLQRLLSAFEPAPNVVLFPAHPRTKARIQEAGIVLPESILMIPPLSYLDMLIAERSSRMIFTDSGGVQREAYFSEKQCVTLRDSTEWSNTIAAGWNRLVGSDPELIRDALLHPPARPLHHPAIFGTGDAAQQIADIFESEVSQGIIAYWSEHRRAVLRQ